MSNGHQVPPQTPQTNPDSQMMLLSHQARNDPLNLNEYVMSDSRHPPLDAFLQSAQSTYQSANATVVPRLPYSIFPSPLRITPRDVESTVDTSSNVRMASPTDRRKSLDWRGRGSFSEVLDSRGSAEPISIHCRASISTTVSTYAVGRTGSVGESSATSRTSSRDPAGLRPDESRAVHDSSFDENNYAYHLYTDHKESRDQPPPWSELKTKAGKERKRLPLACIACRRKKIRCSGEKPACKHCLRSRIPCVYKVTARKAAPRTDYMAMLDKRLRRMEDRVIKIIPKDNTRDLTAIGRAAVKPAPAGPSTKAHGNKKRAAEEAFGGELDDWSSTDVHRAARPPDHPPKVQDVEESRLSTDGANRLPAKDIQEHLAEVFFDYLYGQSYHLLHKPSFMSRLRAGTVSPVLILAVCAVSARFSTHPQVASEPAFLRGECWAAPAREIALDRYDQPNITILTVLLLLGLHEFGTCQGGRSWMLGGMAIRMAYALQLHRELDRDPSGREDDGSLKLSFTDREIRRRTMWSCFLMDRFNSSGTERPTFANEEYIHVRLPVKEALFQMELPGSTEGLDGDISHLVPPEPGQASFQDNMGVAAYMIRIIALWGRVIRYLNLGGKERDPHPLWSPDSQFTLLKTQVDNFSSSLPASLHYTDDNLRNHAAERLANQFLFMHICYNQIILFMHRFAIPSASCGHTAKEMPQSAVEDALNVALDAAKQISHIISVAENHRMVAPFAGYCAFLSSTVHIWGIFSKNPQLEASSKRDLAHNVKYLTKMKKYWGMFHFMTESLKDIYRQHADAASKGTTSKQITHEAGVFQYGDWFTKYPHGVSRMDYEDPATDVKKESGDVAVLSQKPDLQSVEAFFASESSSSQAEQQRRPTKSKSKYTTLANNKRPVVVPLHNYDTEPNAHVTPQWPVIPFSSAEVPDENRGIESTFQHPHPSQIYQQQPQYSTEYGQSDYTLPHQQPNMLPQFDRHLVYGAYASPDTTSAAHTLPNHGQNHSAWGEFTMPGFVQEPTSAWFMPFNMEPPEISGEDPFVAGVNDLYHMPPPPPPSLG